MQPRLLQPSEDKASSSRWSQNCTFRWGHRAGARTQDRGQDRAGFQRKSLAWPGLWGVRMEPVVTVREGYCPHPGSSNTAWFWKALVGGRRWGKGVAAVTPASYPPSALNSKSGFCWDTLHAKAAQHLSGVTVAPSSAHRAEVQLEQVRGSEPREPCFLVALQKWPPCGPRAVSESSGPP